MRVVLTCALWILASPALATGGIETEAETPEAEGPAPMVARAVVTRGIAEREPIDEVKSVDASAGRIAFFTELVGLEGRNITHRWEFEGNVVAEVPFEVGGPRWRVHSTKRLVPSAQGKWSVSVVDDEGVVLASETFTYGGDAPQASPAAPTP